MTGAVPTLTVDRNVIFSVLNREPGHELASRIFAAHINRSVAVAVSAANRVENSKSGAPIQPLNALIEDCHAAGLIEPEILNYPLDWEMGLWEHGIISQEGYVLELALHQVLFGLSIPPIPTYRADDQSASLKRKVTNAKCDVFAVWGHIFFKRDYFVTEDKGFLTRRKRLEELGAKGICTPQQFIEANIVCI
jgi:hypothetical protein